MRNKLGVLLVILLVANLFAFVPRTAVSQATTWGPRIEHVRYPTYLSPDAQTLSMQRRDTEFLTDLMRPIDFETLRREFRKVFGTPKDHFCCLAFNLKNWWLGPMDGSDGPGRALRHAIAHLVPKDELIGTLFEYIATKIEAPGPPAQGPEWYNSNVDPHRYDPNVAHDTLTNGGWTWDAGQGRWELAVPFAGYPAGTPMPTTYLYSPEFETAPTSWQIVRTIINRMRSAGAFAAHPLPADHEPIKFNALLDILDFEPARSLSYNLGGWDAYFSCHSDLGETARFLFDLFHSSQDIESGDNTMHLHNDTLDAQLDIINTSLDHAEKVAAAQEAHRLLMGSPGLQYTPTTDGIIACIPIYSRAQYAAVDEGLSGIVKMLLTGIDNCYTFANMYWDYPLGHESDIVNGIDTVQQGYMVKFCNQEQLQTPLNPAYASSPYTWMVMDHIYDSLIRRNPYIPLDFAWILDETKDPDFPDTPGYYVETTGPDVPPGGMKVTYWMVDDTILWHDGHPVDAFDVEFAWEYQTEYEIGQWWDTFMYFDHADVIDVPYNRTIVAYMTATSQFTPLTMAEMALMFPEHVWGCTHERNGRATPDCVYVPQYAEMYDGTPVTVESGLCGCTPGSAHVAPEKTTCIHGSGCVIDHPATAPNEVYAYDPTYYAHPNPPSAFPWLTELVGTGEFVFYNYHSDAMVSDIVAFDATRTGAPGGDPNVHYWKTTDELRQNLRTLFHEGGDVDWDGFVFTDDHIRMADAYGCEVGDPWYDSDADLNEDGIVDAEDVDRFGRNFGRYYCYSLGPQREWGNPSRGSTSCSSDGVEQLASSLKSLGEQEFSSSSEATIYVDPSAVIDETLQPPSTFAVNLNISDVSCLRTWQAKMSWDPSVLSYSNIVSGDFLKGNPDETKECIPYDDLVEPYLKEEKNPSSNWAGAPGWIFPEWAYAAEYPPLLQFYAQCSTPGAEQIYSGYTFSPVTEVTTIEVGIMGYCDVEDLDERDGVEIQVSNDGGSTWSPTIHEIPTSRQDLLVWVDVTDDFSWTPAIIEHLAVKVRYRQVGATASTVYLNWVGGRVTDTLEIDNPVLAHEGVLDTYAEVQYGLRDASFVIGNATADPYGYLYRSDIVQVELKVRYEATASAAGDRYRILYYGDSYYWPEPPSKIEAVTWTSASSSLATHVWTSGVNLTKPYDPLGTFPWHWFDIEGLQVEVETDVQGGDASAIFKLYEVWLTVTFERPTWTFDMVFPAQGKCFISETTIGNCLGVTGSGWLGNVEFQVLAYGASDLDITHPATKLIWRARILPHIPHTTRNGFFSNKILGDVDGDRDVDALDLFDLSKAYGSEPGDSNWDERCDLNRDNKVEALDLLDLSKNYGRSI